MAETALDHRLMSVLARELARSFTGDVLTAGDAYGGEVRYDRLARVKADYGPDNFFRSNNAAIAPAAGRTPVARHKEESHG